MGDPRQEVARQILAERRAMAKQILAERRGEGAPKTIEMPVQHIEGQAPEPAPMDSAGWAGNAINQFARGATLGAGPYLEAGYRRLTEGGDYEQHLSDIQQGLAEGERRNPVSSVVAQGAGGAVTAGAGAAVAPATVAGQAAMGAGQGALTGSFESGGDPIKTLQGATMGATFAGRGHSLAAQARDRLKKLIAMEQAKRPGAPAVMESVEQGVRKTADVVGNKILPIGVSEMAGQAMGLPPGMGMKVAAGTLLAPHAVKAGRMAYGAGSAAERAITQRMGPAVGQFLAQRTADQADGKSTVVDAARDATKKAANATGASDLLGRLPSVLGASKAHAQPPAKVEADIGDARLLGMPRAEVEIGDARQLERPRVDVEIGEAHETSDAIMRRMAQERRRGRQVELMRTSYVGGRMSPALRSALGPSIESGDAKQLAAAMEDAQQDPQLARELTALQESK